MRPSGSIRRMSTRITTAAPREMPRAIKPAVPPTRLDRANSVLRNSEQLSDLGRRRALTHVEGSEQRVHRAHFIKAHLVDQLFEDHGVVSEQIHTPFPVVKSDGTGNNLLHLPRI